MSSAMDTSGGGDDDDDEEEEVIVYANFEEATIDKEVFQIPNLKIKVIGLDSDTPMVQLRDFTFKGVWSDTIGTKLLLEEDPSPEQVDQTFTVVPETMLKYNCQSTKTLDLSRIFLKPKSNHMKLDNGKEGADEESTTTTTTNVEMDDASHDVDYSVQDVAECVTKPDIKTDSLMKDIVNEALAEDC